MAQANDDDVATITRTLGGHADGISLVLSRLSPQQIATAGAVSHCWRSASCTALAGVTHLDMRPSSTHLDDERLASLLRKTSGLQNLNISGCKDITDNGLLPLCEQCCMQLVELNVACLPNITADGASRICDALPDLVGLELAGCTGIRESDLVARFSKFLELADEDEDGLGACQG